MNITLLNESFISDESLKRLRTLGKVEVFLDTDNEEKAIKRIKDSDIIVADMFVCPLNANVLSKAEKLKFIALNTTGFDRVDFNFCNKKGIQVSNAPGFATDAVAEHTFALVMSVARKVVFSDKNFRKKPFETLPDSEEHKKYMGFNLKGKTLGVIGLGNIGRRVCEIGSGLGMKVIAYNRTKKEIKDVVQKDLDSVLSESDVICLSVALTKETESLINQKNIHKLKKTAIIINTSRDKVMDTNTLYKSLSENKIFGAGLDVIALGDGDHPILKLDNVVFTPHSAWFTREALDNLGKIIVDNVESFVKGKEKNIVN